MKISVTVRVQVNGQVIDRCAECDRPEMFGVAYESAEAARLVELQTITDTAEALFKSIKLT